jgi:alkylation response protein AidB-like acyl-CoA dehydrogenase
MSTAGTSGFGEEHALQRFWRDVHSASSHVMLQLPRAATGFARLALSEEDSSGPVSGSVVVD